MFQHLLQELLQVVLSDIHGAISGAIASLKGPFMVVPMKKLCI